MENVRRGKRNVRKNVIKIRPHDNLGGGVKGSREYVQDMKDTGGKDLVYMDRKLVVIGRVESSLVSSGQSPRDLSNREINKTWSEAEITRSSQLSTTRAEEFLCKPRKGNNFPFSSVSRKWNIN